MTTASTPKGERRRQALVVAAAQLLAEGGFDAIRHRAVADRAGLPLASTTYYFSSLDDLVSAAVEFEGRQELAAARECLAGLGDERLPAETVIDLILDLLLGSRSRDGGVEPVLLRYERLVGTPRRPYLAPLIRELNAELQELVREILERGGAAGGPEQVRHHFALVDGAVVNALIESDPDPRGAARRMLSKQF
ncbi:TetR family transcriptional regulator [Saccharopolyspora erythraea NRRL 2338]|uniref:Transcriptional regulator, TetR family n=2 Tax=Saccharopolyspora erythraea TaxID=1836 RepID=A4FQJ1_SACEN|nr:TetR family transcriptional regulator [Saccharopolyspora erythraea]EQD87715.1 TetR family transcriptional regulator [Saccharopolyspora erythraea D]PFG92919.1 TetR family transcriptional regulator [Saccharopolyspora erythraea NRRL 2338]QRK89819.1 TetR family transcriptional regulator [Saccharopolyspora erythraea]CAM06316.1 putative transcriptional regulator, TetR family [Saccharopolyspora erythraea NRRL 2338]